MLKSLSHRDSDSNRLSISTYKLIEWFFLLLLCNLIISVYSFQEADDDGLQGVHQSTTIESLLGQLAKTVIYGGASITRRNSRLLCSLLKRETIHDNQEQPTLFIFRSSLNKGHAFRIYSDDEITYNLIEEAQFDPRQATVILVHGWLGGIHNEYWLSEAKNVALKSADELYPLPIDDYLKDRRHLGPTDDKFENSTVSTIWSKGVIDESSGVQQYRPNVIIVDWSDLAQGSLFAATQSSHKVARRLGRLLEQLVSVGHLRPELMHCLGHSIGAHICGQAARFAFPAQPLPFGSSSLFSVPARRQRMGRISALDPGGFCYELGIRNETTYLGLRPSDALLTDAYYSNRSPFGNKFQVAQYNVRLNNGFFQSPCSVWRNSSIATEYFRASVRFALGNIGHNDILSCDHYFATRFSHQEPPEQCSYVAYACNNYRDFVRGRCGKCETIDQCYIMDFEYQRVKPSNEHTLNHIARFSSLLSARFSQPTAYSPPGGVPYTQRKSYYMRVANREPYCSYTYRVRLMLNPAIKDLKSFKADAVQLQLLGVVTMRDSSSGTLTNGVLTLHGPWLDAHERDFHGLDNRTLTGMFEMTRPERIRGLVIAYDNERNRQHIPHMQLVESIHFDYLSSTDPQIKEKYSSWFSGDEIDVQFKQIDTGNESRRRPYGK